MLPCCCCCCCCRMSSQMQMRPGTSQNKTHERHPKRCKTVWESMQFVSIFYHYLSQYKQILSILSCTVCAEHIVIPVCAYIVAIFNAAVCLSHTAGSASCQLLQNICSTLSTFLSIAAFVERLQKVTSVNLYSRGSLSSSPPPLGIFPKFSAQIGVCSGLPCGYTPPL